MISRTDRISGRMLSPRRAEDWRNRAGCAGYDPEWWFALPGSAEETTALRICGTCPVTVDCDRWRQEIGATAGIWAGQILGSEYPPVGQARDCRWCRHEFTPAAVNQLFCTPACRGKAERARKTAKAGVPG